MVKVQLFAAFPPFVAQDSNGYIAMSDRPGEAIGKVLINYPGLMQQLDSAQLNFSSEGEYRYVGSNAFGYSRISKEDAIGTFFLYGGAEESIFDEFELEGDWTEEKLEQVFEAESNTEIPISLIDENNVLVLDRGAFPLEFDLMDSTISSDPLNPEWAFTIQSGKTTTTLNADRLTSEELRALIEAMVRVQSGEFQLESLTSTEIATKAVEFLEQSQLLEHLVPEALTNLDGRDFYEVLTEDDSFLLTITHPSKINKIPELGEGEPLSLTVERVDEEVYLTFHPQEHGIWLRLEPDEDGYRLDLCGVQRNVFEGAGGFQYLNVQMGNLDLANKLVFQLDDYIEPARILVAQLEAEKEIEKSTKKLCARRLTDKVEDFLLKTKLLDQLLTKTWVEIEFIHPSKSNTIPELGDTPLSLRVEYDYGLLYLMFHPEKNGLAFEFISAGDPIELELVGVQKSEFEKDTGYRGYGGYDPIWSFPKSIDLANRFIGQLDDYVEVATKQVEARNLRAKLDALIPQFDVTPPVKVSNPENEQVSKEIAALLIEHFPDEIRMARAKRSQDEMNLVVSTLLERHATEYAGEALTRWVGVEVTLQPLQVRSQELAAESVEIAKNLRFLATHEGQRVDVAEHEREWLYGIQTSDSYLDVRFHHYPQEPERNSLVVFETRKDDFDLLSFKWKETDGVQLDNLSGIDKQAIKEAYQKERDRFETELKFPDGFKDSAIKLRAIAHEWGKLNRKPGLNGVAEVPPVIFQQSQYKCHQEGNELTVYKRWHQNSSPAIDPEDLPLVKLDGNNKLQFPTPFETVAPHINGMQEFLDNQVEGQTANIQKFHDLKERNSPQVQQSIAQSIAPNALNFIKGARGLCEQMGTSSFQAKGETFALEYERRESGEESVTAKFAKSDTPVFFCSSDGKASAKNLTKAEGKELASRLERCATAMLQQQQQKPQQQQKTGQDGR